MSGRERTQKPRRPFSPPYTKTEIEVMCMGFRLKLRQMYHEELRKDHELLTEFQQQASQQQLDFLERFREAGHVVATRCISAS